MEKWRRVFIICPVRNVPSAINEKIAAYVAKLESDGCKVYWPYRDNPHQNTDKVGTAIIDYNRSRMLWADETHIWYDKGSAGSRLDLGMFWVLVEIYGPKKFIIINREEVQSTPEKSFENVILAFERSYTETDYFDDRFDSEWDW